MALRVCSGCGTRFPPDVCACPHCGGEQSVEAGEEDAGTPDPVDVIDKVVLLMSAGEEALADRELRHAVHLGAPPSALARVMIGMEPPEGWT